MPEPALRGLDALAIPAGVRRDLGVFVAQILRLATQEPISITVFGSAVTGDYSEKTSDLNLLVVHSDLELEDLQLIAPFAQRWFRKRRFSPRFLSHRNLTETTRYFQVDLVGMRDAHVVLHGQNVLESLDVSLPDLRWQLAHETKRMRMRLKQQYWRNAGTPKILRQVLLSRTGSLLHLFRGLLFLEGKPIPRSQTDVIQAAARELQIDPGFFERVSQLRRRSVRSRTKEVFASLTELLAAVRVLDARVEQTKV